MDPNYVDEYCLLLLVKRLYAFNSIELGIKQLINFDKPSACCVTNYGKSQSKLHKSNLKEYPLEQLWYQAAQKLQALAQTHHGKGLQTEVEPNINSKPKCQAPLYFLKGME